MGFQGGGEIIKSSVNKGTRKLPLNWLQWQLMRFKLNSYEARTSITEGI